ncbi:hypothetical protein EYC84_008623 [Monilinia fructicola]|uniref:Uncharacterized protein n=1 Tax=Monilinia fructicola TaxID=38448 RepID=A0A5M9JK94_MONFR|nr:hypothetical protein EYC84_008623 [Monilinia fructicola]
MLLVLMHYSHITFIGEKYFWEQRNSSLQPIKVTLILRRLSQYCEDFLDIESTSLLINQIIHNFIFESYSKSDNTQSIHFSDLKLPVSSAPSIFPTSYAKGSKLQIYQRCFSKNSDHFPIHQIQKILQMRTINIIDDEYLSRPQIQNTRTLSHHLQLIQLMDPIPFIRGRRYVQM